MKVRFWIVSFSGKGVNVNVYGATTPMNGNDSFFSYGKSAGTNGGGLASKINTALSRVVWNYNNS